jgi:ParB family chromosome partitioning protein
MSLKDKAAKIGFDDLDTTPVHLPNDPAAATAPATAVRARSGVAAITQSIGMHHRVQDLEATVARYEEAGLVVLLDPKRIRPSKWKNRHEKSYSTLEYAKLKAEIEAAGRNVQAIKVRKIGDGEDGQGEYEVVYGRRRHRACLESGLPVAAIIQQMTDVELFQEMERENRNRQDLSAWEQGVMYKDAIDQGLFSSQRQMAAALNIDQGNLSKAIKLASLPAEVVDAFPSPLDLQFRWGTDLSDAMDKDPAKVLTVAEELRSTSEKRSAKEVYARLIGAVNVADHPAMKKEFSVGGKTVGAWARDAKGNGSLKIKPGVLNAAKEKKLLDFLDRLFE